MNDDRNNPNKKGELNNGPPHSGDASPNGARSPDASSEIINRCTEMHTVAPSVDETSLLSNEENDLDDLMFTDDSDTSESAMPPSDDDLMFTDDNDASDADMPLADSDAIREPWLVLIVDDDEDILLVTRLGLQGLSVMDAPIKLLFASSSAEAKMTIEAHPNIAVLITDVVMESEHSGLDLVRWLRGSDAGRRTRIIIRTGQPGFAPEEMVMRTYDINDYWSKTSVEIRRIRAQLVGLIRSFNDLQSLQWQSSQMTSLATSMHSLIGLQSTNAVFDHLEREMEKMDVCWACFETSQAEDPLFKVRVLSKSARNLPMMMKLAEQEVMEVHQRNLELNASVQSEKFVISTTHFDEGRTIALVFCLRGHGRRLRQFLELRGSIYGQAVSNTALFERKEAFFKATKRFVPDRLVDWLGQKDITAVHSGDHISVHAWVLFLDIRGFTTRSEKLKTSEIIDLLQRLFGAIIPKIESHDGVVDKLLGDGLMALFRTKTAPVKCCAELVELVKEVSPDTTLSIGLHGGHVDICALGYRDRIELTAIADTVNIAARLEQANRRYNSTIITSKTAVDSLVTTKDLHLRKLGPLIIRGRSGLVQAVQVLANEELNDKAGGDLLDTLDEINDDASRLRLIEDLVRRFPKDLTLETLLTDARQEAQSEDRVVSCAVKSSASPPIPSQ
jgi:class 3 adenylate cyclase/DNA-binding response OmpR family regulator